MPTLYDNFERVRQYIDQHSGSADLSSYVSYAYLASKNYITMVDVSACGYLTSIPSEYITQDELSANGYISSIPSEYATKSYVAEYVATYAPEPDLSAYVSKVELSACGYLTSIPSEYITQDELSANGYISSIPSEYITESELSGMSYITMADVSACGYLTSIPSEYITQDELSANGYISSIPSEYITESELSGMSYITMTDVSACGYLTSIPSEYITQDELSANGYISSIPSEYITQDELSACGYLTSIPSEYITESELSGMSYVSQSSLSAMSYATTSQLPVIDENLIPKTNNTYSLGSDNKRYKNAYTQNIYSNAIYGNDIFAFTVTCEEGAGLSIVGSGGLGLESDDNIGFYPAGAVYSMGNILPEENNTYSLGSSSLKWNNTYSSNLYISSKISYISDKTKFEMNDRNVDIYANNKKLVNISDYGGFVPMQTGVNLGSSSNVWAATYTNNLFTTYLAQDTYSNSIIPKENNTYTLGDTSYKYNKVYSTRFVGGLSGDIYNASNFIINIGNADKYRISSDTIRPDSTNTTATLGTSDYLWAATYTNRVNLGSDKVYIYNNGDTQMKFGVNGVDRFRIDYNRFLPSISNAETQLGASNNPFTNTYTTNLYTNTAYISSATYLPKNTYWYNGSSYVWLGNL